MTNSLDFSRPLASEGLGSNTWASWSGPTSVVMLHGLLIGSLASWYFTAAPALAKRHRVMLYDLRGHGRSERVASGYDLVTQTGDLQELADRFDDRPIDLVGHSYGGLIALRFALDHPGRVRRLVLVEAPLPPSRGDHLHGTDQASGRNRQRA